MIMIRKKEKQTSKKKEHEDKDKDMMGKDDDHKKDREILEKIEREDEQC